MMSEEIKPPQWAQRLLTKFAHPETKEEVEGDLEELFLIWKNQYGIRKANWKYVLTVLTLLRPFARRKNNYHSNSSVMIGSYFKMSWRALLKNRVSAVINISGLTLGLTTSILILLVVMNEFKYDRFHSNLSSIHVLMKNMKTNDGISTGWSTPAPMADVLRTSFPEVKFVSRVAPFNDQQVAIHEKIFYESGIYADPDLFRIMTFPSLSGDAAQALENHTAVITKSMAKKLFGNEEAIGKSLLFNKRAMTIGAVVENIPSTSTVKFDMVISFAVLEKENEWTKKWDDNRIVTWMQLQPGADLKVFNDKATRVVQNQSGENFTSFFAYPLKAFHLYGDFSNGVPNGGKISFVKILITFGVFMLLIACINFMNIATAQSEHRAKEVGMRKVLGATRKWIIYQFLSESITTTFLALFSAVALAMLVLPGFNTLTHSSVEFDLKDSTVWFMIIGITMITALLAGSYPAFFLSRFLPARVLKGTIELKGGMLRKILVAFQFAISISFVIGTIILHAQFEHVKNRPMGYEQENLVDVQLDSMLSAKFSYLKNEVSKISGIKSITGQSNNILYSHGAITGMDWPGKRPGEDLAIAIADVHYDWCKTMGIKIVQGRDFDPAFAGDINGCIINQSAADKMGLKDPVGKIVGGHPVIGVFQNFVYNNPSGIIAPMAVYLNPGNVHHLYIRIQNDVHWRETVDQIQKITKEVSPEYPFRFSFTRQEFQHRFSEFADVGLMISIFGGMTIFIACLGLFGLSGFVAEKRSKEMSIRKVFGASVIKVLISLTRDFLKPVLFALLLVIPLSVIIAQSLLAKVTYRVTLQWWMFASAGCMILIVAVTIVLYHGWRTARENPIVRLRNE